MSGNEIAIIWTSDQQQLIRDMQKRQVLQDQEIASLKKLGATGKESGGAMTGAYRESVKEIERLGRTAETAFAKSVSPMDAHQQRLKEMRVLFRMGKIDAEQFNAANQASLKKYYDDSGLTERLRKNKAARQKELEDQRQAQLQSEKLAKQHHDKLLAEQDAAIAKREKLERAAAARSLAAQKSQFMEGQRITEQHATSRERHNASVARHRELLRIGAIDQMTFNRAVMASGPAFQNSARSADQAGLSFGALAPQFAGVTAGYAVLTQGVRFYMQANREAAAAADEAMRKQTELLVRYRAQAGLDVLKGAEAKKAINKVALKSASTSEETFGAATALVSTGFDSKEVQNNALLPFMKLIKAQALDPKKATGVGEMAESFSKFLVATGQEQSGENVEKLAIAIQGLKATPMKVTDLGQLAKHASTAKELGRMSPDDMLANFALLTNTEESEEAGTHIREIVRQLATAGGQKKSVDQLRKMGLKPTDIDFVGEDFATVLSRMETGLQKLPEKSRATALDTLVDGRNIAAYLKLARGQGEVTKLKEKMADKAGFEADYEMTSTGKLAAGVRLKTAQEMLDASDDEDQKNDRARLELHMKRKGLSPVARAVMLGIDDTANALYGHENVKMGAAGLMNDPAELARLGVEKVQRMQERDDVLKTIEDAEREIKGEKPAAKPPAAPAEKPNRPEEKPAVRNSPEAKPEKLPARETNEQDDDLYLKAVKLYDESYQNRNGEKMSEHIRQSRLKSFVERQGSARNRAKNMYVDYEGEGSVDSPEVQQYAEEIDGIVSRLKQGENITRLPARNASEKPLMERYASQFKRDRFNPSANESDRDIQQFEMISQTENNPKLAVRKTFAARLKKPIDDPEVSREFDAFDQRRQRDEEKIDVYSEQIAAHEQQKGTSPERVRERVDRFNAYTNWSVGFDQALLDSGDNDPEDNNRSQADFQELIEKIKIASGQSSAPLTQSHDRLIQALEANTAATIQASQRPVPVEVKVSGGRPATSPPRPVAAAGLAGGG